MKAKLTDSEVAVEQAQQWADELQEVKELIGDRFSRSEARERALTYLRGLMSPAERKNGWQLAEQAGDETPYATQHLLGRAVWSADEVRDDLRNYVVKFLGDEEGVLVLDETGFLKKGTKSAGVQRQYSGTAGRVENCQIGVFLAYATREGRTFLDRELYVPQSWAEDQQRRAEAGIPPEVKFATKPTLGRRMIERAQQAGVRFRWVTGDEVYGNDSQMRRWLEGRKIFYVLAVSCQSQVFYEGARRWAAEIAKLLPQKGWKRLSAGAGTKGERLYDWALLPLGEVDEERQRWLLFRRSISDPTDLAYYVVSGPKKTSLEVMVKVAGTRWAIEESFESAKGEVGLDHYEVRSWDGWYRHITLAMFAHAYLTVVRARAVARTESAPQKKRRP
ncbi:MAG TPA: IS701 family transposase [Blastocatellia bacterium]|nr:IS701 family transposase [Blastocatellia bacterium]